MLHELRHSLRSLRRSPGVSLVAGATLALGLGVALGLVAYVTAMVAPRVDAPHPERIVGLDADARVPDSQPFSYPELRELRRLSRTVPEMAANAVFGAVAERGDQVRFGWAQTVTGNYFDFFGAEPLLGRLLRPEDESPAAPPVAVLGYFFWKHRLDADSTLVGEEIEVNGVTVTVVGVSREGFPAAGLPGALYLPLTLWDEVTGNPGQEEDRQRAWVWPIGRFAPGASLQAASEELSALVRSSAPAGPRAEASEPAVSVISITEPDSWDSGMNRAALLLTIGATLLLVLACANVAHLVLAQATAERRQLAVQKALGAGRWRLVGRWVLKGLLLVLAALPFALLLARALAGGIERYVLMAPPGMGDWAPGARVIHFDLRFWTFTAATALATAGLIALAPAFQALRLDLAEALRSDATGGSDRGRRWGLRQGVVVVQVGLAVVLLVGAGLLAHSLWRARAVDPGFDPEGLASAGLFVPRSLGTEDGESRIVGFYNELLERVRALPGVESACLARNAPLGGLRTMEVELPEHPGEPVGVASNTVSPGYFETVGLRLLAGRTFETRDRRDAAGVAIVNRSFADTHLGDPAPVGRSLLVKGGREGDAGPRLRVVGVVEDARLGDLLEPPAPTVFVPFEQRPRPRMRVLLRTSGASTSVLPELRRWLRERSAGAGLIEWTFFDAQMRWALFRVRMNAYLAMLFGLVGWVLAVTGVSSVMAYAVSRRRREMGIRMALGATPGAVRRLAHREALRLVGTGLVLGMGTGLATARFLDSLLYGVEPLDPWTFVAVPVMLLAAALVAADLPARRAARVDPREALVAE